MKKSDLENGIVAQVRKGEFMIYHNGGFVSVGWYITREGITDDLRYKYNEDYDVMRVFKANHNDSLLGFDPSKLKLIWERKEIPEYTIEELQEKIGHEFKIKKQ